MNRRHFISHLLAGVLAASPAASAPMRLKKHPRLYCDTQSIAALRDRLDSPLMRLEANTIRNAPRPMCMALHSLLEPDAIDAKSGERKAKAAIAQMLRALEKIDPQRNFLFEWLKELHQAACVYDWCHNSLTDADKSSFLQHFIRLANGKDGAGYPLRRPVASLVGHEAQGSVLGNHLAVGLALHDDEPQILDDALDLLHDDYGAASRFLFPGVMDLMGVYYARHVHFALAGLMLKATGKDLFFDPSLAAMPYEWVHALRPDGRMLRSGDNLDDESRARKLRFSFTAIGALFDDANLLAMGEVDLKDAPPDKPFKTQYRQFDRLSPEELCVKFITVSPDMKQRAHEARWPFARPLALQGPAPANRIIFRTGWTLGTDTSRDAVVDMRIGQYFIGNHQRKDFGSFQIYFRGPLAIPAGVYQGSPNSFYGKDHWVNFYQQTVSCNGLLVRDPDEKPFLAGVRANDGGQRWPNEGKNHPPDVTVLKHPDNGYLMAEALTTGIDANGQFAFMSGDITKAYSPAKVHSVRRAMFSLNTGDPESPLLFAVYDRIVPANPAFERCFVLHSTDEPRLTKDQIQITNTRNTLTATRGIFSGQYGGRLDATVLLPASPRFRKVKGHRIGDKSFDASKPQANGEECWGRVEVHESGQPETTFLTVMMVADAEQTTPKPTLLQDSGSGSFRSNSTAVIFVGDANETAFNLPDGIERCFLCALHPGHYRVRHAANELLKWSVDEGSAVRGIANVRPGQYSVIRRDN